MVPLLCRTICIDEVQVFFKFCSWLILKLPVKTSPAGDFLDPEMNIQDILAKNEKNQIGHKIIIVLDSSF